jgi:O-antigen ligase
MLACAALLLLGLLLRRGGPIRPAIKYAMVAGLAVVAVPIGLIALRRNQGNQYEGAINTSGRVQAWEFYLSVADRHPFTGNGIGAAAVANARERPVGVQTNFEAPHNEYIHMYVDVGWLVGAVIVLAVAALLFSSWHSEGRMTGAALVTAFGVLALVDNPLSTPVVPLGLALLLNAILPAESNARTGGGSTPRPRWLPRRTRQPA